MDKQVIYDLVANELDNEVYDIMDVVTTEQMQECIHGIAKHYTSRHGLTYDTTLADMQIRVCNYHGGRVSVSTDDATGLSETMWYPYDKLSEDEDNVKNLISMINEAYYATL